MASPADDFMEQNTNVKEEGSNDQSKHFDTLRSFKVEHKLTSAADTFLSFYDKHDSQHKDLFDYVKRVLTEHEAGSTSQDSSGGIFSNLWNKTPRAAVPLKVHTVTTGETFGAATALMRQVCAELQVKETDPQGGSVVILYCPITSRPGSDVNVAMTKVPGGKPVVLVLMHHTRKADYSIPGTSWSDNFPNIVLQVDVLFHETVNGLLTCSHNKKAIRQIQTKLLQMSKGKYKEETGYQMPQ